MVDFSTARRYFNGLEYIMTSLVRGRITQETKIKHTNQFHVVSFSLKIFCSTDVWLNGHQASKPVTVSVVRLIPAEGNLFFVVVVFSFLLTPVDVFVDVSWEYKFRKFHVCLTC